MKKASAAPMPDTIAGDLHRWPLGLVVLTALGWNLVSFVLCLAIGRLVVSAGANRRISPVPASRCSMPYPVSAGICRTISSSG